MACFIWRFNWMPNWKILTSISFSLSSSSDGKGPYMSSVDLQKNTILTQGRLKMIYEKKFFNNVWTQVGFCPTPAKFGWPVSNNRLLFAALSPFSAKHGHEASGIISDCRPQRFKFEVAEMNLHSILISSKSMYIPPSQDIVIVMFCTRFGQCEVNADSLSKLWVIAARRKILFLPL